MMIGEVTPVLFVGLGGAGGKVVGRIASRLRGKWDYAERYAKLAKFAVIDTDQSAMRSLRDGRGKFGPVDETFLISDFDKQQYASLARGQGGTLADPYFTQWVHDDYKFRGGDTAGAGQIRIESRLGLYHALKTSDIHERFLRLLNELRHQQHTMASEKGAIQVHVVFSVMGGTGSGTCVTFPYFMRRLASGLAPIRLFAYAIQPHVYQEVVGANFEDTCANAYASLKEIEYLNQLDIQHGMHPDGLELHYDVPQRIGDRPIVRERPYELTYLIDVPSAFHTPHTIEAVADSIYMQVYSPFGEKQASDVDNFVKHTRQLYPDDLAQETGTGYTVFYGSLGTSMLLVPDDDVLRYCALRFSADAVRTYLLMVDPDIVPADKREEFNRFQIPEETLKTLHQDARNRLLDQAFAQKVELLASSFQDKPDTFWGRLFEVSKGIRERFEGAFEQLVDEAVAGADKKLPELSPEAVGSPTWTPDSAIQELRRRVDAARAQIDAGFAASQKKVGYDWWPEFLSKAGPASSPTLNPYEQRYVLLVLRGLCEKALLAADAPLSKANIDRALDDETAASTRWGEKAMADFSQAMATKGKELRETGGRGFLDRTFAKAKLEEAFEDSRRSIVQAFNQRSGSLRKALRASVRGRLLRAVFDASEQVLTSFRDIDLKGARLADNYDRSAESYRLSGSLTEKLPDGTIAEHFSEANDYAIDEEALLGPSGTRLWDWYYEDQVRPLIGGTAQLEAVQRGLNDALKPRFDTQGREIPRTGDRIVEGIVWAIRENVSATLEKLVKGTKEDPGLAIDDAIALEALYMRAVDSPVRGVSKVDALAHLGCTVPVRPLELWNHSEFGIYIKTYAEQKVARAAVHKASIFGDLDRGVVESIKFAEHTLVGANDRYSGTGPFAEVLRAACGSAQGDFLSNWYDVKRIGFHHYVVGVPLYGFPRVLGELQRNYRLFQSRTTRAWYLHSDRNFEKIPDLDPVDIKDRLMLRLPVLFARERLSLDLETAAVYYRDPNGELRRLDSGLERALQRLLDWRRDGTEKYRLLFSKDVEEVTSALELQRIDASTRSELEAYEKRLSTWLAATEDDVEITDTVRASVRKLLRLTRVLLQLKPRVIKTL